MCETYNDIPKHKKKSSKSNPKKSKHKHNYVDVIGEVHHKDRIHYHPYLKCTECGNLKAGTFWYVKQHETKDYKVLVFGIDEIKRNNPNLEVVNIYW